MAIHHASSSELIDLRPLGMPLDDTQSSMLLHDEQLKVIRLVLPAGKELPEHAVDSSITMYCLEGTIDVTARPQQLQDHARRRLHVFERQSSP